MGLMWVLLIVLLNTVPGLERSSVLEKYHTADECEVARDRVGLAMAEAYPNENTFLIVCEYRPIST